MKHFLCRHIFIYMCVMFLCAICIFCVVSYSEGLAEVNYGAFVDSCGGYLYFSHGKSLKKFCYCPVGHKKSRPSAHRQISTFARQRAQAVMSAARERKIARFFLHAATRWHSARYARFKRNSRKFLQIFFAKNLVCVPKVRTFALANQK